MKRREFITLLGGAAAAWSPAAHAQQAGPVRRISILMGGAESDQEGQSSVTAFREGLAKLGWMEGRNSEINIRWAAADVESMKRFAKELVALQPDLILTSTTPAAAAGRKRDGLHPHCEVAGGQVGGAPQGDCAADHPGHVIVQSADGDVRRRLSGPVQSRRCLPRRGGDCRPL